MLKYNKLFILTKIISPYWMTILPLLYIFMRSIGENIEKEAKRKHKSDLIHINMLYNHYLECLQQKGFSHYTKIDNFHNINNYEVILQNKDIKELEVCKNTYLNFIMAYRKYKNNIF